MRKKIRDSVLKSSTALVAGSILSLPTLLFNPQSALAACSTSGVDPVTVSCAANTSTTNTTNNTSPNAATSDRIQSFNADLIGQVDGGITVDTFGLNLVTTKATGGIAFTNNGAVTTNQNAINALQLDGNGGAVTYGGTGIITTSGTSGNGLDITNIGAGTITVTAGAITTSNGTAIRAAGVDGLVTVNGQGAINAAGQGINATSTGTGGITVGTTAAATINANANGILVDSSGTAGNVSVTIAGAIGGGTPVGGSGIDARINNAANAGTLGVTANANVSANSQGIFAFSSGTGAVTVDGSGNVVAAGSAILAGQNNNAAGTNAGVHVGGTGTTNGTGGVGISAAIGGANNAGNVLVDRTGTVTAAANGVSATTAGSGGVTVTGTGNVTAGFIGINAQSTNGTASGNITVAPAGTVSATIGISAGVVAGSGTVTVTNIAAVTSTAGDAIQAAGVDGLVSVNGQGALNATGGFGIRATSSGTGGVAVNTNAAGTIDSNTGGILAQSSGTAGNVSVITAGVIGGGTPVGGFGIIASVLNGTSAGTIGITANVNVSAAGQGIGAFGSGTGAITVDGSGNVAGSFGGIVATQDNNTAGTNAGVHVGGTGTTNATIGGFGIAASISGANNVGDVLVDRSGSVTGVNGGIVAATAGGGNVTVTGVGNVDSGAGGTGITATSSGGNGNVVVTPIGSVTGTIGIIASAAGTGTSTVTVSNSVTGTGGTAIQFAGTGNTLALNPGFSITGNAIGAGTDTLQLGGAGSATFDSSNIGAGLQYQGFTTFNKNGSSTWALIGSGNQAWSVQSGRLLVNGTSGAMTVESTGVLGGNGTVGNTTINNGGTLSPGNSIGVLTVQGSLVFAAASSYLVEVSPANADRVNVTGTATLGGATVNASFAAGTYVAKQYTILNATGGVAGTFAGPVNTNLPANFSSSLSYDANNAFLNLTLVFAPPPNAGLNQNQQNVANAIVGFFNANGGIPLAFGGLSAAGLTQVSGEAATGTQQSTFNAMGLFMGVLTDPFVAGRGDGVTPSSGATQFAEQNERAAAFAANGKPRSKSERDAYAAIHRKAPPMVETFTQRWNVWAAGYGGSQTTNGNAALGSNTATSRLYGTAVGADYRFSPDTLAGFALAGGGTNFSIANGLGGGRTDLFQAGAFIRHNSGPAYITAALAYGWQDITTDRTVTVAGVDQLRAKFNANAFSGRIEGGNRFVTQGFGITPYAAGQFTTFELPNYAESVVSGANIFALSYAAKSVTATRSELGLRADKSFAMQDAILTMRGRAAWAHDYNADRNIAATFQTLPGASFVVNGAAQARDASLTTVSAEAKWLNGFSLTATFEGEFSAVTRGYAGKGIARYTW